MTRLRPQEPEGPKFYAKIQVHQMQQLFNRYESRPYQDTDFAQVVELLTDSYKTQNPVLGHNWITREELKADFEKTILSKIYPFAFVLEEKDSKEIVACGFLCPLLNFKMNGPCDITQVPTKKDIPRYLRDALLQSILESDDINLETCAVGSLLAGKPSHTGQSLGLVMFYYLCQLGLKHGFETTIGNIVNEKIKIIGKKYLSWRTFGEIYLDDLFVLDTQEHPFQGLNIIQEGGLLNNALSVQKVKDLLTWSEPQTITLQQSKL